MQLDSVMSGQGVLVLNISQQNATGKKVAFAARGDASRKDARNLNPDSGPNRNFKYIFGMPHINTHLSVIRLIM